MPRGDAVPMPEPRVPKSQRSLHEATLYAKAARPALRYHGSAPPLFVVQRSLANPLGLEGSGWKEGPFPTPLGVVGVPGETLCPPDFQVVLHSLPPVARPLRQPQGQPNTNDRCKAPHHDKPHQSTAV